jgi:outer membrane immunogenic protein
MNRLIALLVAGSALAVAAPAYAADLNEPIPAAPVAEPYAEATAFDWTGAYIGATVGYGWGEYDVDTGTGSGSFDADGFTGGLYAGYNYAVTPNWIAGAEIDAMFGPGEDFSVGGTDVSTSTLFFGTARARLGYAFDSVMIYGTGGLAWGVGEAEFAGGSDSNFHVGWTVGGGIEAALTENITARAEYLYVDTSEESYSAGGDSADADLDGHIVRMGVGYKF